MGRNHTLWPLAVVSVSSLYAIGEIDGCRLSPIPLTRHWNRFESGLWLFVEFAPYIKGFPVT
jgi:hypothetical protein